MSFYNWQGPSGKIKVGNSTHFVDLFGTRHSSPIYGNLKGKPKGLDLSKASGQLFTTDRKIPSTWKIISTIK